MHLKSEQAFELSSKYGSIEFNSIEKIDLNAKKDINLDSSSVNIKNLPYLTEQSPEKVDESIAAQVCVCENGQLYLSDLNGDCQKPKANCKQQTN